MHKALLPENKLEIEHMEDIDVEVMVIYVV
jgi:hypothetical protein